MFASDAREGLREAFLAKGYGVCTPTAKSPSCGILGASDAVHGELRHADNLAAPSLAIF